MTLTSYVAVGGGALDVRKLYEMVRPIVRTPTWVEPTADDSWKTGRRRLTNPVGVGALALMHVEFSPDGPLTCYHHGETCEATDPDENGSSAALIYLDTPYGYRGDGGDRCGDLHAYLIREIGTRLSASGRPWQWFDFDHCEWHTGLDGLQTLGDPTLTSTKPELEYRR